MTMNYEGYIANLTIDEELGVIHGEVINTRHVITFSAESVAELKSAFAASIADYRAWCAEDGIDPEKPYSGTMSLRLGPELHRAAAIRSTSERVSLNSWLVRVVECELGHRPASVTHADLEKRVARGVQDEVVRVLSESTHIGHDPLPIGWSDLEDQPKALMQ